MAGAVDLSEYIPLREDEEFILYRCRPRVAEASSVLMLAPVSMRPALDSPRR
jgi:hypothetical protein